MNTSNRFRYVSMGAVFIFAGLAIVSRLIHIQIGPTHESIQTFEAVDGLQLVNLDPARGNIYDRHGRMLAGNQLIYEVAIELNYVRNPETIAWATSAYLGLDYNEVFALASLKLDETDLRHITLSNFVPYDAAKTLLALKLDFFDHPENAGVGSNNKIHSLVGLTITPRLDRSYPEGPLASNVLGFVMKDGTSIHGVEEELHWLLSGVEKLEAVSTDPHLAMELPETIHGADIVLTLDREIQSAMEEILDAHMASSGSTSGSIIVMDPRSGELLGIASYPRMDLSAEWDFETLFEGNLAFNMAIDGYEPGSVFKVITMASALDAGVVEPNTEFIDTGGLPVDGWTIRNWDGGAWGPQTMTTCLQHSLNVCLAWIATERLGPTLFYQYLHDFHFKQPTNVELAREYAGNVRFHNDPDWHLIDLATNSYGQGIEVTPLQMLRAISAVANDGKMMTPYILQAVVDDEHQYSFGPEVAGQPISAATAHTLSEMLATSLEKEASTSLVPGYRVAGKTGTATIYNSSLTNASFVGWGPVDDPQFMVYIWLNKPTSTPWASLVAAPVFRDVVSRLVVLMDIPPDEVRLSMNAE